MPLKNLKSIDTALGLMDKFGKLSHGTSQKLNAMRAEAIFTDGEISAKIKALVATLWGVSTRCEPCLKYYVLKAKELGATEIEVTEMLSIASAMGGCVGEMWALTAYQAYKEDGTVDEGCCVDKEK